MIIEKLKHVLGLEIRYGSKAVYYQTRYWKKMKKILNVKAIPKIEPETEEI